MGNPLGIAGVLALQILAGLLIATRASWIVVGVLIAGGALALASPRALAPLVLAAAFGHWRAGPSSLNMSYADLALVGGVVTVLPYVRIVDDAAKTVLRSLVAYMVILGVAAAAHPTERALLELAHRTVLVGGSVCVGLAISSFGLRRRALRAFVLVAAIFSVAALVALSRNDRVNGLPAPAYPFGLQKNPAALLIAMAILVLLIAGRELALARPMKAAALTLLFAGMLACQSRGASIALTLVLLGNAFRSKQLRWSFGTVVACTLLLGTVYVSFSALLHSQDANSPFNTVNSRLAVYDNAIDLWKEDPVVGAGIRYWTHPGPSYGLEPHNLLFATLGEAGLVGLAATLMFFGVAVNMTRRLKGDLGALALWALSLKLASSLFDIFWVAGTMTVPWILIGLALATTPRDPTDPRRDTYGVSRTT